MKSDRDQNKKDQPETDQSSKEKENQHSSAFRETSRGDEKSTTNIEEEADPEQERKGAMSERD
jgi:hypothetical protein